MWFILYHYCKCFSIYAIKFLFPSMGHSWELNYNFFPSFLHNWTVHKPVSSQEIKCGNRCGLQLVYTPKSCLSELSRQQWDTGSERWWRLWGTMEGLCLNWSFFLRCVCVHWCTCAYIRCVCAGVRANSTRAFSVGSQPELLPVGAEAVK